MKTLNVQGSQECLFWRNEKSVKKMAATILAAIISIGILLGGIFGGGTIGTCAACIGALALSATILYGFLLYYCQATPPIDILTNTDPFSSSPLETSHLSTHTEIPAPSLLTPNLLSLPLPACPASIPIELVSPLNESAPLAVEKLEDYPTFYSESRRNFEEIGVPFFQKCLDATLEARQQALSKCKEPLIVTIARSDAIGLLAAFAAYREGATIHLVNQEQKPSEGLLRLNNQSKQFLQELLGPLYEAAVHLQVIFPSPCTFCELQSFPNETFAVIEYRDLEWLLAHLFNLLCTQDPSIVFHQEWQGQADSSPTHWVIGSNLHKCPFSHLPNMVLATFSNPWGNQPSFASLNNFVPEAMLQGCMQTKKLTRKEALLKVGAKGEIRPHLEAKKVRTQIDGSKKYKAFADYQKTLNPKPRNIREELTWAEKGEKWLCHAISTTLFPPKSKPKIFPSLPILTPYLGEVEEAASELLAPNLPVSPLPQTFLIASAHTVFFTSDWSGMLFGLKLSLEQDKDTLLKNMIRLSLKQHLPDEAIDILMTQLRHTQIVSSEPFIKTQEEEGGVKAFSLENSLLISANGVSKGIEDVQEMVSIIKRLNDD